ncbi:MAG: ATP synthase F1 subunit epsilon [Thermoanaerobacteraceae bacterium]|nr:ATP synthase F1 subunit epsilon [Thermoanaerobacteraceae bacterium]
MSKFHLIINTPTRGFFEEDVDSLVVKTFDGEIGILRGHEPIVIPIDVSPITIRIDGEVKRAYLAGGFMNVMGDVVEIFSDDALWPEEIDIKRAEEAKKRAEERMKARKSQEEFVRARTALARAMARLEVAEKGQKALR